MLELKTRRKWEMWDRISHLDRERVRESETVGDVRQDLTPRQRERVRQWEIWDRISHLDRERVRESETVGDVGQDLTPRQRERE